MQYRHGCLPTMTSHQPVSSGSGSDGDRVLCPIPVSVSNSASLKNFLHRPPPSAEMFDQSLRVKQEPMEEEEEEEERGMVIDLTPRNPVAMQSSGEGGVISGGGGGVVNGGGMSDSNNPYTHGPRDPAHAFTPNHRHHSRNDGRRFQGETISTDSDSGSETNSNASSVRSGSVSSSSNGGDSANMVTGTFRFSIPKTSFGVIGSATQSRAKREFVPDCKKDAMYWNKRIKNNDSARRSRIKRKTMEKLMEHRLVELQQENMELRYELNALKRMFGEQLGPEFHSKFTSDTPPPSSPSTPLPGSGLTKASSSSSSSTHSTSSSPLGGSDDDVQGKQAPHDRNRPPPSHAHSHSRKPSSRSPHNGLDLSPKTLTSQPLRHYARSGSFSSLMSDASSGTTSAMPASESCTENSPCSSTSPQGSPGSLSGPQTSEEEGGGSAGSDRRLSGADDESLQKLPWKCRMKSGLHSVFATTQNSTVTQEDMK